MQEVTICAEHRKKQKTNQDLPCMKCEVRLVADLTNHASSHSNTHSRHTAGWVTAHSSYPRSLTQFHSLVKCWDTNRYIFIYIHMWHAINHSICKANICLWSTLPNSLSVWLSICLYLFVYYISITCTCIFIHNLSVTHCWNRCTDMLYNCVIYICYIE